MYPTSHKPIIRLSRFFRFSYRNTFKPITMAISSASSLYTPHLLQTTEGEEVPNYKEQITILQRVLERYTNISEGQDIP